VDIPPYNVFVFANHKLNGWVVRVIIALWNWSHLQYFCIIKQGLAASGGIAFPVRQASFCVSVRIFGKFLSTPYAAGQKCGIL